jgi:SHS2 domain-containing protein
MYETFEHTADLGLRIRAANVEELFVEAGRALFSVIVEDLNTVHERECIAFELSSDSLEFLLFDWLKELLYRFDGEHLVFGRFEAHVDATGLRGRAWGEPLDPERHRLLHEVKAITYHGLRVEQSGGGWLAEVIVDI